MLKTREFCRTRANGKFRRNSSRRENSAPSWTRKRSANYVAALQAAKVDLIVLAGFMRVLKGDFLRAFEGRIVNIHPSLLPSFPGLEAWKQALDHGVKVTGCTVHFVDAGVDAGPIIGQQTVPVLDNDTAESLHAADSRGGARALSEMRRGDCARGNFRGWATSCLEKIINHGCTQIDTDYFSHPSKMFLSVLIRVIRG